MPQLELSSQDSKIEIHMPQPDQLNGLGFGFRHVKHISSQPCSCSSDTDQARILTIPNDKSLQPKP